MLSNDWKRVVTNDALSLAFSDFLRGSTDEPGRLSVAVRYDDWRWQDDWHWHGHWHGGRIRLVDAVAAR